MLSCDKYLWPLLSAFAIFCSWCNRKFRIPISTIRSAPNQPRAHQYNIAFHILSITRPVGWAEPPCIRIVGDETRELTLVEDRPYASCMPMFIEMATGNVHWHHPKCFYYKITNSFYVCAMIKIKSAQRRRNDRLLNWEPGEHSNIIMFLVVLTNIFNVYLCQHVRVFSKINLLCKF